MGVIEELPDDFEESMSISDSKSSASVPGDASTDGQSPYDSPSYLIQQVLARAEAAKAQSKDGKVAPDLPPGLAAMHGKTGEEMLAELNKTPLFMTELEENDDLEAMKALAYEGTPAEVAQGFKERGNECFKAKRWVDAKEFYGKAVQVLQVEERKRRDGGSEDGVEAPTMDEEEVKVERALQEACLVNRAACHLELSRSIPKSMLVANSKFKGNREDEGEY